MNSYIGQIKQILKLSYIFVDDYTVGLISYEIQQSIFAFKEVQHPLTLTYLPIGVVGKVQNLPKGEGRGRGLNLGPTTY